VRPHLAASVEWPNGLGPSVVASGETDTPSNRQNGSCLQRALSTTSRQRVFCPSFRQPQFAADALLPGYVQET
jgi:hypothetical protein